MAKYDSNWKNFNVEGFKVGQNSVKNTIDGQRVYDAFRVIYKRWQRAYSEQNLTHAAWVRGVVEVEKKMYTEFLKNNQNVGRDSNQAVIESNNLKSNESIKDLKRETSNSFSGVSFTHH